MRGYGEHLQYSVFLCELTPKLEGEMKEELEHIIKEDEDQVLIIPLQHRVYFETIGLPLASREREMILVMPELEKDR